jgi:hypothetical protein
LSEDLPINLKDQVGRKVGPYEESADPERIDRFRRAVGAAPGSAAPPTFLTICRKGEFALFEKFGFKLSNVLHAEQLYAYGEPILAGDRLVYETWLANALEKSGSSGKMRFLTFETEVMVFRKGAPGFLRAGGARTTIVVRGSEEPK